MARDLNVPAEFNSGLIGALARPASLSGYRSPWRPFGWS